MNGRKGRGWAEPRKGEGEAVAGPGGRAGRERRPPCRIPTGKASLNPSGGLIKAVLCRAVMPWQESGGGGSGDSGATPRVNPFGIFSLKDTLTGSKAEQKNRKCTADGFTVL